MIVKKKVRFMLGNEAIVEGALLAGATFFAGYPITPSSEVAERASRKLPQMKAPSDRRVLSSDGR